MRSAGSYRGARRKAARESGEDWNEFQAKYWSRRARALAALEQKAMALTPAQAREALGRWAANQRMNAGRISDILPPKPKPETDAC